jgi:hypothetical protein
MAEYLVVSHPKQFEYHGTLDDVDAASAHGASLVTTTGRWATFRAADQSSPEMARFPRDGACRR